MRRNGLLVFAAPLMIFSLASSLPIELRADSSGNAPFYLSKVITPAATVVPLAAPAPELVINKATPKSALPFWRKKPELLRQIKDERKIVVAVRREDLKDLGLVRFTMQGVGWVSRDKNFSFDLSQRYHLLKSISEHFREVTFNAEKRELFLVTEAMGYQARMILKVSPVSEDWRSEIQWEVVWGHFKGMKGYIGFEKTAENRTEVSVQGTYEAAELPLPKVLMGFALEVITQKVAEKMRAFIEAQPAVGPKP